MASDERHPPKLRATTRVKSDQIIITIGDVNAGMLFMADFVELRDMMVAGQLSTFEAAQRLTRILDEWRESQKALDEER